MQDVFVLHHVRADDEYGDDAKLIGVYRTRSSAGCDGSARPSAWIRGHPNGWHIDRYVLDQDHWEEGFAVA